MTDESTLPIEVDRLTNEQIISGFAEHFDGLNATFAGNFAAVGSEQDAYIGQLSLAPGSSVNIAPGVSQEGNTYPVFKDSVRYKGMEVVGITYTSTYAEAYDSVVPAIIYKLGPIDRNAYSPDSWRQELVMIYHSDRVVPFVELRMREGQIETYELGKSFKLFKEGVNWSIYLGETPQIEDTSYKGRRRRGEILRAMPRDITGHDDIPSAFAELLEILNCARKGKPRETIASASD